MKAKIIILTLIICLMPLKVIGASLNYIIRSEQFSDWSFTSKDLVLNNLMLSEESAYLTKELVNLKIQFTAKNTGQEPI